MASKTMSKFVIAAAAAVTLAAQPATAQHRGGGGGTSRGAAVPRGGGSHGASPRGGHGGSRPGITGRAIPRTNVVRPRVDQHTTAVVPPYGRHIDGGFGLGLRAYRYPSYSYGYPGYYGGYSSAYYGGYPSTYYGGYYGATYSTHARVRILGAPRNGQVFIDGDFAGIVDDFDGVFQHLEVTPGPHQIEIRADGFAPVVVNVQAIDGRTIDFRAQMVPAVP